MGYALAKVEHAYSKGLLRFQTDHSKLMLEKASCGSVVYVVEGDATSRQLMGDLLSSLGFTFVSFCSPEAYLDHVHSDSAACLILNLQELHGRAQDLQCLLRSTDGPPAIFVTNQCDTVATVLAMKAGAVEVLSLPVEIGRIKIAILEAFTRDMEERRNSKERMELKQKLSLLTPREREVLPLVAGGLLNKQAASILGISQVTLQIHRGQIMRKMVAASFAELVLMAAQLGLRCPAAALDQFIVRPRAYGT